MWLDGQLSASTRARVLRCQGSVGDVSPVVAGVDFCVREKAVLMGLDLGAETGSVGPLLVDGGVASDWTELVVASAWDPDCRNCAMVSSNWRMRSSASFGTSRGASCFICSKMLWAMEW